MKKIKNQLQINKILSEHTLNDFNKWYEKKYVKKIGLTTLEKIVISNNFDLFIGVLIVFAESRGFKISITYSEKFNYWNYYVSHCEFGSTNETGIKSFKKIAKLALEEFDKRYNNIWNAM